MWPILYENIDPPVQIGTYGVLLLIAFSVSFLFVHSNAAKHGFDPDRLVGTYLAAAIGGVMGARLFTALTFELKTTLSDPSTLFTISGLTYYGGVLGGAITVMIVAKVQGFAGWKFLDLVSPALVIGHLIGRLGCFFGGCCHGAAVQLRPTAVRIGDGLGLKGSFWFDTAPPFFATEFHAGVGRLIGEPLYPTQLWSVVFGIAIVGVLTMVLKHKRFDGQVVAYMLILEPLARFFVELYRADRRGVAIEVPLPASLLNAFPGLSAASTNAGVGLTTSQAMGLIMVFVGIVIWVLRQNRGVAKVHPPVSSHNQS